MGWFSKRPPEPDPIGGICRLLVDRCWEWVPQSVAGDSALSHPSGVRLVWSWSNVFDKPRFFIGIGAEFAWCRVPDADAWRLHAAVQSHAFARVASTPRNLDDTAAALVAAYTAGGDKALDAALRLADHIFELHGGTKREEL